MNSVKLNRGELLKIVRENKEKHIADYLESVEDYKKLVLKIAIDNLELAKTGDLQNFKEIKQSPAAPTSYEESYTRAIRMLELSVDDIIELQEANFNQLVLDEWTWKRGFTATTMAYKSGIAFQ